MRVINDRNEKETSQQFDFFAVFAQTVMIACGFISVIFGPLAILGSYARMTDPWPKVTALAGAIFAVVLFQTNPIVAAILFVFSLFVADTAWNGLSLPKLILGTMAVAVGALGIAIIFQAEQNGLGVGEYARQKVAQFGSYSFDMYKSMGIPKELTVIREEIIYQGPFQYVSVMLFAMLVSVGCASHLRWFPEAHTYNANKLRKFSFPTWMSLAFVFTMILTGPFVSSKAQRLSVGVLYVIGSLMFFQGMIVISRYLSYRNVQPRSRTVLYSLASVPCVLFTVALGVLNPWLPRRANRLEEI